jgi:hypothetical protein
MFRKLAIAGLASLILFVGAGCSKKAKTPQSQPLASQSSLPPMTSQQNPMLGMPMMKENPMTIKQVTGVIEGVQKKTLILSAKGVILKFGLTPKTEVLPKGRKLISGLKVKIMIKHVPSGMEAKEVDILK